MLSSLTVDPAAYDRMVDWCCMVALAGTGANTSSSTLSFATSAVLGAMDHVHKWAHNQLELTLGKHTAMTVLAGIKTREQENNTQGHTPMAEVVVAMLAQVMAVVIATIQAGEGGRPADGDNIQDGSKMEELRTYS